MDTYIYSNDLFKWLNLLPIPIVSIEPLWSEYLNLYEKETGLRSKYDKYITTLNEEFMGVVDNAKQECDLFVTNSQK